MLALYSGLILGKLELATRLTVVQLIADYVDAVMWFHAVGLLPEHSGSLLQPSF